MGHDMKATTIARIQAILKRYGISISHFSQIIGKDRRTLASWLHGKAQKDISLTTKARICEFFRYPMSIWTCSDTDFIALLESIPTQDIRIIDEGYAGSLRYMLTQEINGRFVVQPRFPAPAYRDLITQLPQNTTISYEAKLLMQERSKKILDYHFKSTEWYSIESLLYFGFCAIGNPYTQRQKILILENLYKLFFNNPNKQLYLFDSTADGIFNIDMNYMSIIKERNFIFFRLPINALIVEIANANFVHTIYHYFTIKTNNTKHIQPADSLIIIASLLESIQHNETLMQFYNKIREQTAYAGLFASNIAEEYRSKNI